MHIVLLGQSTDHDRVLAHGLGVDISQLWEANILALESAVTGFALT